jgi:PPOX class probable F420-dependent enzyme
MNEHVKAIGKHRMWFGTYTREGKLVKVQVWCYLNGDRIEFITDGGSLKVKRARRNPQVVCVLGSPDGPEVSGTAELIADRAEVWRGYQTYWKQHAASMLVLWWPIRRNIERGRQIMVRIHPQEPNPLRAAALA